MASWRTIDLALRVVYVALAPFALAILRMFMPITGALIGTGLATAVALAGDGAWLGRLERVRIVGRLVRGVGAIGRFYREHPPKPLVYYVLYPLLLPIVVWFRVPRRELILYRRVNAFALLAIVGTAAWEYVRHWRPELRFEQFLAATIVVLLFQLVVTVMLIMPITTTLIMVRQQGRRRLLGALLVLMALSGGVGLYRADPTRGIPIMTMIRIEERTAYARDELRACLDQHPDDARGCLVHNPGVRAMGEALFAAVAIDPDAADARLAAARERLERFYQADEAAAFRLASDSGTTVVYARFGRRPAIWLGLRDGKLVARPEALPASLRAILGL